MRSRVLAAIGVLAIAGFTLACLLSYNFRPTAGTVFLTIGWASILGTGYLLVRAVQAFDLRVGVELAGDLTANRRAELEREKKLLIKAIKEAEFDRDSGKLDGGEAAVAIGRYRARAVEILRLLEVGAGGQYEALIEKEVARRLAALPAEPAAPRLCPSCAVPNDDDAAFCKKCGAKLEAA
jgi:hypothetical protein